jgi:hypothetical protein
MSTIVAASASAFEGAALRVMGSVLNLDPQFINHFMQQHKDLTSNSPLIGGVLAQAQFAVAEASRGDSFRLQG